MLQFVSFLAVVSLASSCAQDPGGQFQFSTVGPQGVYRVELRGKLDPPNASTGEFYIQKVKLEAFKHDRIVFNDDEFYREDPYDPLFLQAYPVHEWADDSTLRLGRKNAGDPFRDEISIRNATGSRIDFLTLRHGRYEQFLVFDLEPGEEITLYGSPQLNLIPPASSVWYSAYVNGQYLRGTVDKSRPSTPADGPQKIQVTIVRE